MGVKYWLIFFLLGWGASLSARLFEAEGSDLLMGVGPAQIARGGAVVASDNGLYALYWNPAGLADIRENQIAVAGQFNRSLAHISFAGAAFVLPHFSPPGFKGVLGVSYLPRVHFKAEGHFKDDELETTFLETALPGMPGGFTGKLDSETNDYRIGLGGYFDIWPHLSLGVSVGRVKCHTLFSGYRNDPNDPADIEIHANAWAIDLGMQYHLNERFSFGAVLKHINGDLDVERVTTDKEGTRTYYSTAPFIKDMSVGMDYRYASNWQFSLGYQKLFGQYSSGVFDVDLLRFGSTYHTDLLSYHFGLVAPLRIEAGAIQDFELPVPVLPTVGATYEWGDVTIDAVFYIHPVMTFATHRIKPALDIAIRYVF